MGAGLSVIFSGCFPELVHKLVLIEGFGHVTQRAASAPKILRLPKNCYLNYM